MTDLVAFLRACFDEDERVARVCAEVFPSPWDVEDRGHSASVASDAPNFHTVARIEQSRSRTGRWPGEHLEHIARHDPARRLADIESKRRIVDDCADMLNLDPSDSVEYQCLSGNEGPALARDTLRHIAQPYADRPGFDPAWRID